MRHVSFIDQTGLHNLKDTINILKNKNINVILSGVNSDIQEEFVKFQLTDLVSEKLIFDNFNDAVKEACNILDYPAPK